MTPNNFQSLDERIQALERLTDGITRGHLKPQSGFWRQTWDEVRDIGAAFANFRYPTAADRQSSSHRFQRAIDNLKAEGNRVRREMDARKDQSRRVKEELIAMARSAFPGDDDAFMEFLKVISGLKLLEIAAQAFAEILLMLLTFGLLRPDFEQDKRGALKTASENMKRAWEYYQENKHLLSFEDRKEVTAMLGGVNERLQHAWDEFKREQQARVEQFDARAEKKREIITEARSLSRSTDWKETAAELDRLFGEWKKIGHAGRAEESLWSDFSACRDEFYNARRRAFASRDAEFMARRSRKEKLCREAESLADSDDWKDTAARFKALHAEWKEVGFAGRDHEQELWDRFHAAQEQFFQRRHSHFEEKQEAFRAKLEGSIEWKRKKISELRESIEHDESLISDWREKIDNLRPGGRADEIREALEEKIESVEAKIDSKEKRIADLQDELEQDERKLEEMD